MLAVADQHRLLPKLLEAISKVESPGSFRAGVHQDRAVHLSLHYTSRASIESPDHVADFADW